jgi:hypothetical protein
MNNKLVFLVMSLAACVGCGENPVRSDAENPVRLVKILDQVNEAIQQAKQGEKDRAPHIDSVQLDLQLGTANSVNGSFPISFVTPQAEVDHGATHQISLVFTPKMSSEMPVIDRSKMSELATAIRAIDEAVIQSDPNYQFQHGSVKIQCTFSTQLGANAQIGQLVPISLGASRSKEAIQTVTLNFSPRGSAPAPSPSDAPVEPVTVVVPSGQLTPHLNEPPSPMQHGPPANGSEPNKK